MRALAGALTLLPGAAFACALPPSVILTLPTGHYIAGAALTVALTAIMGAMARTLPRLDAVQVLERRIWVPLTVSSYLSFLCFLALVLVGLFGARDPMHNLMTLVFWTGVWIALPLASMAFGNLWRPLNPWTGPVRIARTLIGRTGAVGLHRLGYWPAVLGFAGFTWFQLMSMSPDDPTVLAWVALAYWLVIFALAVAEGEDWLAQGEFLTVLMGYLAKVSPVWLEIDGARARLMRGWPGAQVLRMPPLSVSAMAFVTLVLSALTFDGLMETFWWHGIIGENPLEPTGRSAVIWVNTLGLLCVWASTVTAIWAVIRLGQRLGGQEFAAGPVMLSFLAIAAGYHASHYLITLLTAGQYTLAALNDPWFRGDAYLGLPPFYVSFGFLTDQTIMPMIYAAQFGAILAAHLLAVVLSLRMVGHLRAIAHAPMTVLMVAYTVLGLWLLSTARTG
ncbi:hypothetical protein [Pseudotabrizicola algicola]|uniref:Uncharacterized protein n=1 Tax=Pseudotabrizicola algicola TaxID=2709381 RepID=A0A6B3RTS5_9RHOB|nr:hypothetical protein [Pseudotabrizicola algicola]NEX46439.1 hypothetical protein [Pseudotabrizicola algicola]